MDVVPHLCSLISTAKYLARSLPESLYEGPFSVVKVPGRPLIEEALFHEYEKVTFVSAPVTVACNVSPTALEPETVTNGFAKAVGKPKLEVS
jgi:hypothetical protein